ncbi:MAG: nucleotidyltransferase domain-containing protein [Armatimonadetes bacterium]|nr:nucleotidyltransferase domain-containing protein [Armatimonadota bacterium]
MGKRKGLGKADIQPILDELKAGLQAIYGPRLRQVILFGSYARGEAEPHSDVDVALVLDDYDRSVEEARRIEDVWGRVCLENGVLIQPLFVRERDAQAPWQPVHLSIRQEGVLA